jgi:hypothetical protein
MAIEATAEAVIFREPRGEWRFTIDGKNSVMDVPGGRIHSESKWDHGALRQEFSSAQKEAREVLEHRRERSAGAHGEVRELQLQLRIEGSVRPPVMPAAAIAGMSRPGVFSLTVD